MDEDLPKTIGGYKERVERDYSRPGGTDVIAKGIELRYPGGRMGPKPKPYPAEELAERRARQREYSSRSQHSPSRLDTLSYTNNMFDKTADVDPPTSDYRIDNMSGRGEVDTGLTVHTAQTVQQYNALRHITNDMSVRSVKRPRKGHAY